MKKFKSKNVLGRLSAAALSLSLLSAATSCGKPQQQQGNNTSSKPGRIMVIGKADPTKETFWEDVGKGVTAAGSELNCKVDYKCAEDDSDIETQRKYVQEAIEKSYDAIVIAPNSRDEINDLFMDAVDKGIKVLTIDSMSDYEGISCAISSSDSAAGTIAGTEAARLLKSQVGKIAGVGKIAIIGSTSSTAEVRIGAFKTAFSLLALNDVKNPSYAQQQAAAQEENGEEEELIDPSEAAKQAAQEAKARGEDPDKAARAAAAEAAKKMEAAAAKKAAAAAEAQADAQTEEEKISDAQALAEINNSYYIEADRCVTYMEAYNAAKKLLEDENNGIKVMYGTSTNTTQGICQAVEEAGLEDDVIVVGFNTSPALIDKLKSNILDATIVQNPYNIGYFSISYAKTLIAGDKVPSTLDTGVTLATAENINDPYIQILLYPDKEIELPEVKNPNESAGGGNSAGGPPDGVTTGGAPEGAAGGPPEGVTTGGAPEGAADSENAASNGGNQ